MAYHLLPFFAFRLQIYLNFHFSQRTGRLYSLSGLADFQFQLKECLLQHKTIHLLIVDCTKGFLHFYFYNFNILLFTSPI